MIIKFIKWFNGYLLVTIKGYSPERFINLCSSRNILIWNLRKAENGYQFNISIRGFRQLKPIVRKTKTRPYILSRRGLPFLLHRHKKRKAFLLGVFLFFLLLYVFSLHIWDIGVSGEYTHTKEAMIKYLRTINVYSGVRKSKVNCQAIEDAIRKKYVDIGWVSAEIRGTRLLIKLTETNMPAPYEEPKEPCHIIASRDGIVKNIVIRKGAPVVRRGTIVRKGDVLISGIIDITDDFGVLKEKDAVVADGDIILKTFYNYKDEFDLNYSEKKYTGESIKTYGVSILNKNVFFFNPLKKMKSYENYDIIVNESLLKLGNAFYLPAKWFSKKYQKYTEVKKTYSKTEAEEKANKNLDLYIKKLNESGVILIKNNVKLVIDKNKCTAFGKLIVEQAEKSHRKIEDSEWRMIETDEHNGDNN